MTTPLAGQFPFLHGVYPDMYRKRLWTMRQYAGFGTAEESNARYRYLLERGGTGLSVAFDLPTQLGLDSDDARAAGEVGRAGVAIATLDDMQTLFAGIPLDKVSTSMTINASAGILLAMYIVVAESQGVAPRQLSGTVQNDLLKEFAARGNYIFPADASLRLTSDIIAYCTAELPKWNPISISGYHMREAGCTAAQEIGFTLAHGLAYVQAAVDRGLAVDDFGPRLSFFFNAHNNFLEEVAKFRAVRRLWARLLRDRYGAGDDACRLRFHTQTGGSTLTAQQVDNNIVRVAYQAMAAVLGGTQSLHTNACDEALALPTEASARTALRTQQIVAHETGVREWIDPLAGSYVVEQLTDQLDAQAQEYIRTVESMGGAVAAITAGYTQREIHQSAYAAQGAIEAKRQIIVGVNDFIDATDTPPPILKIGGEMEIKQRARLAQFRVGRDPAAVAQTRAALDVAARSAANLMPPILACVRARCTLGEIITTLRAVFGEFCEPVIL